jgi:hypothetical protein
VWPFLHPNTSSASLSVSWIFENQKDLSEIGKDLNKNFSEEMGNGQEFYE